MRSEKSIRIMIIDGHDEFKRSLKNLLTETIPQSDICFADADKLRMRTIKAADIVLIDGAMWETSGLEIVTRVRQHCPECKNIILTNSHAEVFKEAKSKGDIVACVDKRQIVENLLPIISKIIKRRGGLKQKSKQG